MRNTELRNILAYVLAGVLSVGGAFFISMRFIAHSVAQESAPLDSTQAPPQDQSGNGQNVSPPQAAPMNDGGASEQSSGLVELEGFLEPFIYDMVNRRDPFLPFAEFIPTEDVPNRPMSLAQRFSLDELRLVGIMWDVRQPRAMFMDPDKEVLMLGRDESIGNRNGYIAAIREGEVVVVESVRKRGEIIYRTRVLRLER